jgi:putative spermidine/putrescine transport system permease protein
MKRYLAKILGLLLFLSLSVLPLAAGLAYALLHSIGLAGLAATGFTLEHWKMLLASAEFWQSLGFSAWVAFCSIIIALSLSLAAVVPSPEKWQKGPLSHFIYFPLTLPAMVVALLVFQLLSGAGFISRIFSRLGLSAGIEDFPELVNDPLGAGIIISHVLMATPFFVILFAKLYQSERLGAYQQLAATLGASAAQCCRKVLVPILLRRAFPTLVLYFVFVMGSYEIPLLLGSQSPQMISVMAVRKLQRFDLADRPQAYIVGVLYSLLALGCIVLLLSRRTTNKLSG